MSTAHYVHHLDPILFQVGSVAIHWYGIAYVAGFFVGIALLKWLARRERIVSTALDFDQLLFYVALGVIVGGRLGEALFYAPELLWPNPLRVFAVWEGGMSSHGGMLGALVAILLYGRRYKTHVLAILDLVVIGATPGLFFGRLANFVNAEMVGRVSDVSWAVIFPLVDNQPRHPVQLYQAFAEGPILFLILMLFPYPKFGVGSRLSAFLVAYSALRVVTEQYRQVDAAYLGLVYGLTKGQWLSIGMALIGVSIFVWVRVRESKRLQTLAAS